jgi:hypothetical protein
VKTAARQPTIVPADNHPGTRALAAQRAEQVPENLAPGVALMTSYDLDQQHQIMTDVLIDGVRAALPRAGAR